MTFLEVLQLIGYSTGAALHLWISALLFPRRHSLGKIEVLLLALSVAVGVWHTSNLIITLHFLLGLSSTPWVQTGLRLSDTLSVISITASYSLLLHVHLYLWARVRGRVQLTRFERVRIILSYLPLVFLAIAIPPLWTTDYAPMFIQLEHLLVPFGLWAAYVLGVVAVTDLLIAKRAKSSGEKKLMRWSAASFILVAALILCVVVAGFGRGNALGLYLQTFANLGSLLPTALLAYHIYRYRYLELIIKESLVVASFAAVVLVVYLFGVRSVGTWLTTTYGLRPGVIESLLILALAIMAVPLRGWINKGIYKLFKRETSLYRDVVMLISEQAGHFKRLPDLLRFVEERTAEALNLSRIFIIALKPAQRASDQVDEVLTSGNHQLPETRLIEDLMKLTRASRWKALEDEQLIQQYGFEAIYVLRREESVVGLMLICATSDSLTRDVRAVLEVLASQVAIAIQECHLVEENTALERRLAEGERLASLGRMAATVAHEVKNPLSAIKSIAQVMREDQMLCAEYARDLDLIVGETDRLSRSVTQLLSFARNAPPGNLSCQVDLLIDRIVELFRAEAERREVILETVNKVLWEMTEKSASAVYDALSNLLVNALHATPDGGHIRIEAQADSDELVITIADSGPGIALELRERIWEPFFTTKQRGTGLGLAIVRKRMEEIGGDAHLVTDGEEASGALFKLQIPLKCLQRRVG